MEDVTADHDWALANPVVSYDRSSYRDMVEQALIALPKDLNWVSSYRSLSTRLLASQASETGYGHSAG